MKVVFGEQDAKSRIPIFHKILDRSHVRQISSAMIRSNIKRIQHWQDIYLIHSMHGMAIDRKLSDNSKTTTTKVDQYEN